MQGISFFGFGRFFFGFVFWPFFSSQVFRCYLWMSIFQGLCSRQWGVTNQAALRKANGNFCRALLIAVKAPRQIQYRHGYIYVSMQISSYICVKLEQEREGETERVWVWVIKAMQIAATSAIGPLSARNFSLIIIVHQDATPLTSLSLSPSLCNLCVQPISGSKALNEPNSTAKCHQQQQEQPVHGQGSRGRKGKGSEWREGGAAGWGSQSGSLLKCCTNFICKLWQKRGLYANLHCTLWQGVMQRGEGVKWGGFAIPGSGFVRPCCGIACTPRTAT